MGIDYDSEFLTHIGIAHTRWATHGVPNAVNSHPQRSDKDNGKIYGWACTVRCSRCSLFLNRIRGGS